VCASSRSVSGVPVSPMHLQVLDRVSNAKLSSATALSGNLASLLRLTRVDAAYVRRITAKLCAISRKAEKCGKQLICCSTLHVHLPRIQSHTILVSPGMYQAVQACMKFFENSAIVADA